MRVRRLFACCGLIVGCHGASVEPPATVDSSADGTGDASLDGTADASGDGSAETLDAAPDASGDADLCHPAGNLVVNGDFASGASGWNPYSTKFEPAVGPCDGKGLRLYEMTNYGSLSCSIGKALPKGTKMLLRAYLRLLPTAAGTPPSVGVRGLYRNDAGDLVGDFVGSANPVSSAEWQRVESAFELPYDTTALELVVASRNVGADEFFVAGVSLVVK